MINIDNILEFGSLLVKIENREYIVDFKIFYTGREIYNETTLQFEKETCLYLSFKDKNVMKLSDLYHIILNIDIYKDNIFDTEYYKIRIKINKCIRDLLDSEIKNNSYVDVDFSYYDKKIYIIIVGKRKTSIEDFEVLFDCRYFIKSDTGYNNRIKVSRLTSYTLY